LNLVILSLSSRKAKQIFNNNKNKTLCRILFKKLSYRAIFLQCISLTSPLMTTKI
jgi:hypothetical protein